MTAGATTSTAAPTTTPTTQRPRSRATTRRATYSQTPEQIAAANRQHAIEQLAHLKHLKREAFEVELNLADLTRTAVRIGEASRWQDARLTALDETIHFWRLRYLALTRQISAEGAQVAALAH